MSGKIFICYRRDDDPSFTWWLYDRLKRDFAADQVFFDVDSISPGSDFVDIVNQKLDECDFLLAVIGKGWLNSQDQQGQRRLEDPNDYVRIEIEAALKLKKTVIPILVGGTPMPAAGTLPEALVRLAQRHALSFSHNRFSVDYDGLVKQLKAELEGEARRTAKAEEERKRAEAEAKGAAADRQVEEERKQAAAKTRRKAKAKKEEIEYAKAEAKRRAEATVFRDIDKPWCPELVAVPSGSFSMGSPEDEGGREDDESPQHEVRFAHSFALGRYAVTAGEYTRFTEATGHENGQVPHRDRGPVTNVSWRDAKAYLAWLSAETGAKYKYRLPSEAEWEYACRAGTTTRYFWGDEITPKRARYNKWFAGPTEVGTYPANYWGLYDMHGNVSEFCRDCWNSSYKGAPDDGSAWTRGNCRWRVMRGGSCNSKPLALRSAYRSFHGSGDRNYGIGFRVARTLR